MFVLEAHGGGFSGSGAPHCSALTALAVRHAISPSTPGVRCYRVLGHPRSLGRPRSRRVNTGFKKVASLGPRSGLRCLALSKAELYIRNKTSLIRRGVLSAGPRDVLFQPHFTFARKDQSHADFVRTSGPERVQRRRRCLTPRAGASARRCLTPRVGASARSGPTLAQGGLRAHRTSHCRPWLAAARRPDSPACALEAPVVSEAVASVSRWVPTPEGA